MSRRRRQRSKRRSPRRLSTRARRRSRSRSRRKRRTPRARRRRSRSHSRRKRRTPRALRRPKARRRHRRSKLNGGMNTPSLLRARTRRCISPAKKMINRVYVLTPDAISEAVILNNEELIIPGSFEDHLLAAYEVQVIQGLGGFTREQLQEEMLVEVDPSFLLGEHIQS